MVDNFKNYYGKAILGKVRNLGAMKNFVYAVLSTVLHQPVNHITINTQMKMIPDVDSKQMK